jgi:hypothetical protein
MPQAERSCGNSPTAIEGSPAAWFWQNANDGAETSIVVSTSLNPPIDCGCLFLRLRRLVDSLLLVDAASAVAMEVIRAVLMTPRPSATFFSCTHPTPLVCQSPKIAAHTRIQCQSQMR